MHRLSSVFVLAVLLPHVFATCGLALPGSTFDLKPLRLPAGSSYTVRDVDDSQTRNFSYAFNVCQDIPSPTGCSPKVPASLAVQVTADGSGRCFRLGSNMATAQITLLDSYNPTVGLSLKYTNGDMCPGNISRQLQINLLCSDRFSTQPDDKVFEDPSRMCNYELSFHTVFACPLECGSSNRKLCSGHGVCNYDTDARASRCFCDPGFTGAECSVAVNPEDSESSCGKYCVALIFIAILLAAGVVAVAYLSLKMDRLSTAQSQFTALRSSIDEEGAETNVTVPMQDLDQNNL